MSHNKFKTPTPTNNETFPINFHIEILFGVHLKKIIHKLNKMFFPCCICIYISLQLHIWSIDIKDIMKCIKRNCSIVVCYLEICQQNCHYLTIINILLWSVVAKENDRWSHWHKHLINRFYFDESHRFTAYISVKYKINENSKK